MTDFANYMSNITDTKQMPEPEFLRQWQRWKKTGDKEIFKKLVASNLGLVLYYLKKKTKFHISMDMVQAGNLGLIHAIKSFDPKKGCFSTYAMNWIRAKVNESHYDDKTIRIPRHLYVYMNKMFPDGSYYKHGIDLDKLADELKIKKTFLQEIMGIFRSCLSVDSLDKPIDTGDGSLTVGNTVKCKDNCDDFSMKKYYTKMVADSLKVLTKNEANVIRMRYGLGGRRKRNFAYIGNRLGFARQRAHQCEVQAIKKLKEYFLKSSDFSHE